MSLESLAGHVVSLHRAGCLVFPLCGGLPYNSIGVWLKGLGIVISDVLMNLTLEENKVTRM